MILLYSHPLLDLIERNPDIRGDISVAIIQSASAKDLLEMTMQIESIPANQLYQSIIVNEHSYGSSHHVTVQDIIRVAGMGKEQVAVPAIKIIGNKENKSKEDNITPIQPESYPIVASMAVFKKGKLAGYLTPTESRGYGWLKNKIVSTDVKLQCPNEKRNLMVEIQKSITAVKSKIDDQFAIFDMAKYINIEEIVVRVEVLVALVWIGSSFMKLVVCVYVLCLLTSKLFKLSNYRPIILPYIAVMIPLSMTLYRNIGHAKHFSLNIWGPYSILQGIVIPLLLFAIAVMFHRKHQYDSNGGGEKLAQKLEE